MEDLSSAVNDLQGFEVIIPRPNEYVLPYTRVGVVGERQNSKSIIWQQRLCSMLRELACALVLLSTYPAVTLFFFALTLLCPYFTLTYPAALLIFFALTLLCPY